MTSPTVRTIDVARRMSDVSSAFLWMGWRTASSYPMSFAMQQLNNIMPVFIYYFVARLVAENQAHVGGDYYSFVVIGIVVMRLLASALRGVSEELELAISEGRFEALLMQPVQWRLLPFGLVQWPMAWRLANVSIFVLVALLLGARLDPTGLPLAVVMVLLGMVATMAVGILAAAVKLFAKRTDPVLTVYAIVASVVTGVFFPIELLPGPVRAVAYLIPDTHVIMGLRQLLMPGGETLAGPSPLVGIVGLAVFDLVVLPLSIRVFARSLEYGRRTGVLGGY